jgi:elongator complex protein 2
VVSGVDEISHELVARQEAHKRIIWACSWNPFCHQFATGSRDKTVKIWEMENGHFVKHLMTLPPFKSSVTALSWVGLNRESNYGFLAVGMESGLIELWCLSSTNPENGNAAVQSTACIAKFDPFLCHVSPVHRLAWRNSIKNDDCSSMHLASCGADHTVRVFNVGLV